MWKVGTLALLIAAVLAALVAGACGPSGSAGQVCMDQPNTGVNGEIASGIVGSGCGGLNGTVEAGQACESGYDCLPACCSCAPLATDISAAVGYCQQGICAAENDTCCTFIVQQTGLAPDSGSRTCQ